MAHISHRYSILWKPEAATETTSTLVLTSKTGWYIDVRINLDRPETQLPVSDDALLKTTGQIPKPIPVSRIEWAFSGQGSSTPASKSEPAHSSWEHWVDSRTSINDNPVSDAGFMYPMENGMTLEKGAMVNPATGVETDYEEVWENLPIDIDTCHIFKHEDPGNKSRGIIMTLGSWCQIVLKVGHQLHASRWLKHPTAGNWELAVYAGDKFDESIIERVADEHVTVGSELVDEHGLKWTCQEISRAI